MKTINMTGVKNLRRQAAMLLIIESLLILVPLIVLGMAINWPANLDEPASVNLPLLLEQYPAMLIGYGAYLVYSLLFWPLAYITGRAIIEENLESPLFRISNGFAAMSAIARSLGIVRWLFAMPVLARLYVSGSSEMQEIVSVVYDTLNAYGGGIGELLGVSLFAAIWLVLISILILRSNNWPNWLGYFGLISVLGLSTNLLELVGVDLGAFVSLPVTVFHIWMLALAVVCLRSPAPTA